MQTNRRRFLGSAAVTLGFLALKNVLGQQLPLWDQTIFGPLVPDKEGIIDLPAGFTRHVFSTKGDLMDDGFFVPDAHDGMAAFPGPNGRTILVRNHELTTEAARGSFGPGNNLFPMVSRQLIYDAGSDTRPCLGGTTTLVYDTQSGRLEKHFLSLIGTLRNCAGGPTPWGTWITCEENLQRAVAPYEKTHGYNFEVKASSTIQLTEPVPLVAMGRFNHEAVCVDPATGIVYQTEDRDDSLLYRFLPERPGDLRSGRLQVMRAVAGAADSRNWTEQTFQPGQMLDVEWIDLNAGDNAEDDLRRRGAQAGAMKFARGEGIWMGNGNIYFVCTSGGRARKGQVWRLTPETSKLQLFVEPNDESVFNMADNLTITPWGDLLVCEDGPRVNRLLGITPQGRIYPVARNAMNTAELAGCVFSPDQSTLFVNIYSPGMTVAITGPWNTRFH